MNVTNGMLCLILAAIIGTWEVDPAIPATKTVTYICLSAAILAALVFFIGPSTLGAFSVWVWLKLGPS